jgi:hypothetical protein
VLVAATVAAWIGCLQTISAYDDRRAHATQPVSGRVVRSQVTGRGDPILVEWRDALGGVHQTRFEVHNAKDHPVGSDFGLRTVPGVIDKVYPTGDDVSTPATNAEIGLLLLSLMAWLPFAWAWRLWRWWRLTRAAPVDVRIRLYRGFGTLRSWSRLGSNWAEVTDVDNHRWYQRVMWEPWLAELEPRRYRATAQRLGGRGVALLTMAHGGRLWPAGVSRAKAPSRLESLEPDVPRRGSRGLTMAIVAVLAGVAPTLFAGWFAGLAAAVIVVALVLYTGGPAIDLEPSPATEPGAEHREGGRSGGRGP